MSAPFMRLPLLPLLLPLLSPSWCFCMDIVAPSLPVNEPVHLLTGKQEEEGEGKKNATNCQAPRLEQFPAGRHASSTYVNWSSQVTLVFIYRSFQLCMTNFAQSHYLKQFVSMWEATPSPSWKVGGENVIIHRAPAWIIKRSQEFKREK